MLTTLRVQQSNLSAYELDIRLNSHWREVAYRPPDDLFSDRWEEITYDEASRLVHKTSATLFNVKDRRYFL